MIGSPPKSLPTICKCWVVERAGEAVEQAGGADRSAGGSAPPRDDYDQSSTPAPAGGKEDFDDDIPF